MEDLIMNGIIGTGKEGKENIYAGPSLHMRVSACDSLLLAFIRPVNVFNSKALEQKASLKCPSIRNAEFKLLEYIVQFA